MYPQDTIKLKSSEIQDIRNILQENEYKKQNLISILQSIQEKYDYLPSNVIYFISEELKTSPAEPLAIERNWENSAEPPRSKPSAMFDIIETEALLIWSRRP